MKKEIFLGDSVRIKISGEEGIVQGIATYLNAERQAFVHFKAADGRATSCWWEESNLEVI